MNWIKHKHINARIIVSLMILLVSAVITFSILSYDRVFAPINPVKPAVNSPKATIAAKPVFNKLKYSTSNPASIWVIVNKSHPLTPSGYTPTNLVQSNGATINKSVLTDFNSLIADAKSHNILLTVISSYRSYSTQSYLYNNYVSQYGQVMTDTFSARPGYSEHQTGLAIDFGSRDTVGCNLEDCFGTTKEGAWLKFNAPKYGFILRYSAEKQSITGYKSEAWHYRYVGRELVVEMNKEKTTTLEEFFHISGGLIYK